MSNPTILVIRDGILSHLSNTEEEKKEIEKKNWDYRMTSKSGQYMVIDYDKDQARPYVKALLAKVNRLREVKMLYITIAMVLVSWITLIFFFVLLSIQQWDMWKALKTLQTAQVVAPVASMPYVPHNVQPTDTGAVNELNNFSKTTLPNAEPKPTNHLFQ